MDQSIINTVAGMSGLQKRIDTLANNVANVNTPGFKRRDTTFSSLFVRELQNQLMMEKEQGRLTPLGIRPGSGSRVVLTRYDFSSGSLQQTGVATDFALEGPAFFQVRHATGNDGEYELRFTRDGSFHVDAAGNLVTSGGDLVLDDNGDPIRVPEGYKLKVEDGEEGKAAIRFVNVSDPSDVLDEGTHLGVYYVRNPQLLESVGDNQFIIAAGYFDDPEERLDTSNQHVDVLTGANGIVAPDGVVWNVHQGQLEMSNVDMVREMTALIESQRTFQMGARAFAISEQMIGLANDLKG